MLSPLSLDVFYTVSLSNFQTFLKHLLSRSFRHLLLPLVCFQHVHLNRGHVGSPYSESRSLVFVKTPWPYPDSTGGENCWVYTTSARHRVPAVRKSRTAARQGGPVPSSRAPDLKREGTWDTMEHACPCLWVGATWDTYNLDYW